MKKFFKKLWQIFKMVLPKNIELEIGETAIFIELPSVIRPDNEQLPGFNSQKKDVDELGRFSFDLKEVKRFYSTFDTYRGDVIRGVVIIFYDDTYSPFIPINYNDFLYTFKQHRKVSINRLEAKIILKSPIESI